MPQAGFKFKSVLPLKPGLFPLYHTASQREVDFFFFLSKFFITEFLTHNRSREKTIKDEGKKIECTHHLASSVIITLPCVFHLFPTLMPLLPFVLELYFKASPRYQAISSLRTLVAVSFCIFFLMGQTALLAEGLL